MVPHTERGKTVTCMGCGLVLDWLPHTCDFRLEQFRRPAMVRLLEALFGVRKR